MVTTWNEGRGLWFVDGVPVRAGAVMEMQDNAIVGYADGGELMTEPGAWFEVRIELRDSGRTLDAIAESRGAVFRARRVAGFEDGEPITSSTLRWPTEGDGHVRGGGERSAGEPGGGRRSAGEPGSTLEVEMQRSDDEVLAMARKRLRLALEMLGGGLSNTVLDESLVGAGILAHDAGDLLKIVYGRRTTGGQSGV